MTEIYLTEEQLEKIKSELEFSIHTKRKEIVARIKEAKEFGDLSENSEYDSAREEQAFVEARIKELETMIANAKIISDNVDTDSVGLGTTVTYLDTAANKEFTYKIVGVGSDPKAETPSISAGTPIAKKILGKKVGEEVEVDIPAGKKKVKIQKIQ